MEFEFGHGGEIHKVEIETVRGADGSIDGYLAIIGEKEYRINPVSVSPESFSIFIDGKNLVAYAAGSEKSVYIHIDGRVTKLDKVTDTGNSVARVGFDFGSKDEITTPMPGKVVKILVKRGDKVKVKQPLVIVESMKMENEIKSPTEGEVKSIHFGDGDLVEPGQPIIKLIPAE